MEKKEIVVEKIVQKEGEIEKKEEEEEDERTTPREFLDTISSIKNPVFVLMKRPRQEVHGNLEAYDDSFNLVVSNATSYFYNDDGTCVTKFNKKILLNGGTVTCIIPAPNKPEHEDHSPFFAK